MITKHVQVLLQQANNHMAKRVLVPERGLLVERRLVIQQAKHRVMNGNNL